MGPLATEPRWPRRLDNIRVRGALELWRPGEETPPEERGRHGLPMDTHEGERLASREVGEVMFLSLIHICLALRTYGPSAIWPF